MQLDSLLFLYNLSEILFMIVGREYCFSANSLLLRSVPDFNIHHLTHRNLSMKLDLNVNSSKSQSIPFGNWLVKICLLHQFHIFKDAAIWSILTVVLICGHSKQHVRIDPEIYLKLNIMFTYVGKYFKLFWPLLHDCIHIWLSNTEGNTAFPFRICYKIF